MVILPVVFGYGRMLKKDIVYTAITRASQTLLLCGEKEAFLKSVSENTTERLTSLSMRISGEDDEKSEVKIDEVEESKKNKIPLSEIKQNSIKSKYILTPSDIELDSVDPMIGMEGIKP